MRGNERCTFSTSNLAEVQFLLERRHRVVEVGRRKSWPNGIDELCVTLEGRDIEADHRNFLCYGGSEKLTGLKEVFETVMDVMYRQDEEAFYRGRE